MSELIYKSLLLSGEELMVACALSGIKELPFPLESRDLSAEELNGTLFALCKKGFLLYKKGNVWELKPEILGIFSQIRDARRQLEIYSPRMGGPLLCFQKEDLAVMEVSENDRNAVAIHRVSPAAFPEELRDRGILPARDSLEVEKEEGRWGDLLEAISTLLADNGKAGEAMRSLVGKHEEVMGGILVRDPADRTVESALLIVDGGISDWIFIVQPEDLRVEPYTLEGLKGFLF